MLTKRLLSHNTKKNRFTNAVNNISQRIVSEGDKPHVSVEKQLELLHQLTQFDFGCFLLENQGINGFWTHYMLTHPRKGKLTRTNNRGLPLSKLEEFILERAPTILATQQRFEIFLAENQKAVKNDTTLASIPCGMMGELLYLDFKKVNTTSLVGIDYDKFTFHDAKALADERELSKFTRFIQKDAWSLKQEDAFHLISSNGLNIYEPCDTKVENLYQQFYTALKTEGRLVTSFLTPPPELSASCEWKTDNLNNDDLELQRVIFSDIIGVKWQCFRSSEQTRSQLLSVGFRNIQFLYDDAHIFPTVVAVK